jgi:hypothetical protein
MRQPFGQHPSQRGSGGGDLGDCHDHRGFAVSGQFTACVEAKPTDPQHGRAYYGQSQNW